MDQEKQVLRNFLDAEREHVLGILDGLSEEQLRRPCSRPAGAAWAW
jgi:hypothetical protein